MDCIPGVASRTRRQNGVVFIPRLARVAGFCLVACAGSAFARPAPKTSVPDALTPASALAFPPGADTLRFDNLEGILLVDATLRGRGGRDTSGTLVIDTGAGFLALDHDLAYRLGVADSASDPTAVEFAESPVARLAIGTLTMDQVSPVLTINGQVIRRVTDRPVLGLLGQRPLSNDAVLIDYREQFIAILPLAPEHVSAKDARHTPSRRERVASSRRDLAALLSPRAAAIAFTLSGDGKIVVRARLSNVGARGGGRVTLILDTGASKCVVFANVLARRVRAARGWPTLRGLSAPTLVGSSSASVVLIPQLDVASESGRATCLGVDAAVMESDLEALLSGAVGEPVHGLLGYSFLKNFRILIDYPHRVVWLDPLPAGWDQRPWEYSHVGIQIERADDGAARVVAVAEASPAAVAGIAVGDELVAIDDQPVSHDDLIETARKLEGPPGSRTALTIRHGSTERTYRLVRRKLL